MNPRYLIQAQVWSTALPARDLELRTWGLDVWKLGPGQPIQPLDDSITFSGITQIAALGGREWDLAAEFAADLRKLGFDAKPLSGFQAFLSDY